MVQVSYFQILLRLVLASHFLPWVVDHQRFAANPFYSYLNSQERCLESTMTVSCNRSHGMRTFFSVTSTAIDVKAMFSGICSNSRVRKFSSLTLASETGTLCVWLPSGECWECKLNELGEVHAIHLY